MPGDLGATAPERARHALAFGRLVAAAPPQLRVALFYVSELVVLAFFVLLAWVGLTVLEVLEGDTLVSLPWVPVQFTQSVIPIGAALFILGQLLSLPEQLKRFRDGTLLHEGEIPDSPDDQKDGRP